MKQEQFAYSTWPYPAESNRLMYILSSSVRVHHHSSHHEHLAH